MRRKESETNKAAKQLVVYLQNLVKDGKISKDEADKINSLASILGMARWTDGAKNGYYR